MKKIKITNKYIAFFDDEYFVQIPYDEYLNLCKPNIEKYIDLNGKDIEVRKVEQILKEFQVDNIVYFKECNCDTWKMADVETYNKFIKPNLEE